MLSRPTVGPLLQIRFVFGFAFVIFQTVFALYAQYRLGLDARSTSYVLSYVGVPSVVTPGRGLAVAFSKASFPSLT